MTNSLPILTIIIFLPLLVIVVVFALDSLFRAFLLCFAWRSVDHSGCDPGNSFRRLPYQFHYPDRNDGLLSIRTGLADPVFAVLHYPGLVG